MQFNWFSHPNLVKEELESRWWVEACLLLQEPEGKFSQDTESVMYLLHLQGFSLTKLRQKKMIISFEAHPHYKLLLCYTANNTSRGTLVKHPVLNPQPLGPE